MPGIIFKPKDFIAALVIVGFIFLRLKGANGDLDAAVFLILGYYFAKRENGEDNGK